MYAYMGIYVHTWYICVYAWGICVSITCALQLMLAALKTLNRRTCRPRTAFPLRRVAKILFSVRSARPK